MDPLARAYVVLGLKESASDEEINKAYRDLVKVWHPERFEHDESLKLLAQEKRKEISAAYDLVLAKLVAGAPRPSLGVSEVKQPKSLFPEDVGDSSESMGKSGLFWGVFCVISVAVAIACSLFWNSVQNSNKSASAAHIKSEGRPAKAESNAAEATVNSQPTSDTNARASSPTNAPTTAPGAGPGRVVADYIITVADDFVVDVFLNGKRVDYQKRSVLNDLNGATSEKVQVAAREGDWLVFNVVNNRLRWDGACYFAAAGMRESGGVSFASELHTGQWSCCDDVSQVARFIAEPEYLASDRAHTIEHRWSGGEERMRRLTGHWMGEPVWGTSRNTWIKYRVPLQ